MAAPWMKFYPRDWRGDQALRMVSLTARGLWIECLAIMHEASPYGHLVVNGRRVGDDALARMVGVSGDEVRALLAELREAGVCDVTGEGVIFSRRMVRDQERANKGRKAIKKRWSQAADIKAENGRPNRLPNSTPITQKPEARVKKDVPDGTSKKTPTQELETVLDRETANAVVEHRRKTIKKPLTPRAAQMLARKFSACPNPVEAANAMIVNGWQGFEPEWLNNRAPRQQAPPPSQAKKLTYANMWSEDNERPDHPDRHENTGNEGRHGEGPGLLIDLASKRG